MKSVFILLLMLSTSVSGQDALQTPVLDLPHPAASETTTGSNFLQETASFRYQSRQEVAVSRILEGNIPFYLRELVPVQFRNAQNEFVTIWVTADYLAIGTDKDFIRMPLSMPSAQKIAKATNMYLPTAVMADSIYAQAHNRLNPMPMKPGEQMRSNDYYRRHNEMIEEQLAGVEKGLLVAGHRKDVVITNRLKQRGERVAIYGWHYAVDAPIQPLSTVHSKDYEDYSHGLRLVYPVAEVNGESVELKTLINQPEWNSVFTREGTIDIELLSQGE
jgi:hypothetical protein